MASALSTAAGLRSPPSNMGSNPALAHHSCDLGQPNLPSSLSFCKVGLVAPAYLDCCDRPVERLKDLCEPYTFTPVKFVQHRREH